MQRFRREGSRARETGDRASYRRLVELVFTGLCVSCSTATLVQCFRICAPLKYWKQQEQLAVVERKRMHETKCVYYKGKHVDSPPQKPKTAQFGRFVFFFCFFFIAAWLRVCQLKVVACQWARGSRCWRAGIHKTLTHIRNNEYECE